MGYVCC
jgi:phosphoglycolate phosphatase-like HAD superfamily hydrolase